jgi:phage terminase large subunit GpA-like protein
MVTHLRGGRPYRVYEKVGPNVRNEALDVRVYALVARAILNPNYEAIAKRRLKHIEPADMPPEPDEQRPPGEDNPDPKPPTGTDGKVLKFPRTGGSLTKNNPFRGYRP